MANFLKSLFVKGVEIDTTGASSGNVLSYNGTKFAPAAPGTGALALNDLSDVTVASPNSNEFLKYNGSLWVADAIDLGTDTTGNYMVGTSASTGIVVSHTPSEGSTATIAVDASYAGFSPIGGVIMWVGTTANIPTGYAVANGASLSTTTYASLFNIIGYRYGGSGGSFLLPNFTNLVPEGITGTPTIPSTIVTGIASAVDAHTHSVNSSFTAGGVNSSFTAGNATSHTHPFSADSGNQSSSHYHYWSAAGVSTSNSGNHTHGYFKPNSGANNNTNSAGDHSHTWSLYGQRTGTDSIANAETTQVHYHTVSGTTGNPNATSVNSSFTAGNVNSSFTAGNASTLNTSSPAHTHTLGTLEIIFIIRVA